VRVLGADLWSAQETRSRKAIRRQGSFGPTRVEVRSCRVLADHAPPG
jgi:hypothetical protein